MKKKLFILISLAVLFISSVVSYFVLVYKSPAQIQQEQYWSDVNRDVEKVNKNLKEKGISLTTIRDELLSLKYDMNSFREADDIHNSSWKNYSYRSNEVTCKDLRGLDIFLSNYSNNSDCQKAITGTINTTGNNKDTFFLTMVEFKDIEKLKLYFDYVKNTNPKESVLEIKHRLLMTRSLSKYVVIMHPYINRNSCDFEKNTCTYNEVLGVDPQTSKNMIYTYDVFSRLDLV